MSDADRVTAEMVIAALNQIERTPPAGPDHGRLVYWATESQYNSEKFMAAFRYMYPDVEVRLQKPIPI